MKTGCFDLSKPAILVFYRVVVKAKTLKISVNTFFPFAMLAKLNIEAEMHDIPILHNIFFAFQAHFAGFF